MSAPERSVFMLREVFNLDYDEIAEALDKKADSCRQLLSRAKKALELPRKRFRFDFDIEGLQAGFQHFMEASRHGKLDKLIEHLKEEIEFPGKSLGKSSKK